MGRRLGAKLNGVGLFELLKKGVGAKRAIVAGGLPESRSFATGEAGEAIAPSGRVGPVALELAGVEPGRSGIDAQVDAGGGPGVAIGSSDGNGVNVEGSVSQEARFLAMSSRR